MLCVARKELKFKFFIHLGIQLFIVCASPVSYLHRGGGEDLVHQGDTRNRAIRPASLRVAPRAHAQYTTYARATRYSTVQYILYMT